MLRSASVTSPCLGGVECRFLYTFAGEYLKNASRLRRVVYMIVVSMHLFVQYSNRNPLKLPRSLMDLAYASRWSKVFPGYEIGFSS